MWLKSNYHNTNQIRPLIELDDTSLTFVKHLTSQILNVIYILISVTLFCHYYIVESESRRRWTQKIALDFSIVESTPVSKLLSLGRKCKQSKNQHSIAMKAKIPMFNQNPTHPRDKDRSIDLPPRSHHHHHQQFFRDDRSAESKSP